MPIFTLLPMVACGCIHTLSSNFSPVFDARKWTDVHILSNFWHFSAMDANGLTPCFLGILISYNAMSLARLSYALSTLISVV